MAYTPNAPPSDPKALAAFLQNELWRIAAALNARADIVPMRVLAVEPAKRQDGDLAFPDGTNWNPGQGMGLYERVGGVWVRPGSRLDGEGVSAAKGFVLADANRVFLHPSADTTARIWTIPANASVSYPLYTCLTFVNQDSAGVISIAITSDTMRLAGPGTTGTRSLAANGIATVMKVATTEWLVSGVGLT